MESVHVGQGTGVVRRALRDLPLYTTESEGIVLNNYPEWRAAVKMVKRLEREMEPDPPEPVDFAQCQRAIFELRQSSPRAALFLSMMWALASRAGDIASLRQKDVTLSTTVREDGMVALGIEQKYGKGTRFRGTYWPASTLQPEEASELRKHLGQNESDLGSKKLFPDQELLRQQIRAALKRQNRECALPSVRRGDTPPRSPRANRGRPDAIDGAQEGRDPLPLSRTWPPRNAGGRSGAGRRLPGPPPAAEKLGHKAPSTKELGLDMNRLYLEVQRLSGVEDPVPLPDRRHWRLHLKNNTPLDAEAVFALPTAKESTVEYLREAWRFMQPERYEGLMTSRDLKATQLSQAEIDEAIRMGKFEECSLPIDTGTRRLPYGWHGVNVFTVPELKGRRRLITEPPQCVHQPPDVTRAALSDAFGPSTGAETCTVYASNRL
eukprot:gene3705-biopygen2581